MSTYPLLFSFRDIVAGNGYFAGVAIDGRALLVEDDEGAWFYGVDPGGIAGYGATAQEAHQDFRAGYRSVLADFADEATDFQSFKELTEDFLSTVNRPNEVLFKKAVELVESGELNLKWLPQRSSRLSREMKVVELDQRAAPSAINDPVNQSLTQSLAAA